MPSEPLIDESLETSALEGLVIGMRLFEAGPFHAGFGIIVEPQDDLVALWSLSHNSRSPPVRAMADSAQRKFCKAHRIPPVTFRIA
ncbi:hypothetical protein DA075_33540 [Methylobacterium currus]|uniref:Uncharacterized protein n=2 Tax=Methylobacterium currus TaxID=2051553 RepID=A0A2R4WW41_9HYPH|nr:hypothetical protein DA075_33540 [Methylobacterium currus]